MLAVLVRKLAALRRDQRGGIAIFVALGMPLILAAAAFSVETSYHYYKHQKLQGAADAAAYAGALEKLRSNDAAVTTAATSAATENGWQSASGTIQVNTPPTSGSFTDESAVEVILTQNEPRFFSAVIVNGPIEVRGRAVASFKKAANACILALNDTQRGSVDINGAGRLTLVGCDVAANSTDDEALQVQGTSTLTANCASAVGGILNAHGGLTLRDCPGGLEHSQKIADPFKNKKWPDANGPCLKATGPNLSPGNYCNGISITGSDYVTMDPGVYYVSKGLDMQGTATLAGKGVTLIMVGDARVKAAGTSTMQLEAPTDGDYAGMLFLGDRASSGGQDNRFLGTSNSSLTGHLYFPTQPVYYGGDFSGVDGCINIVADTIKWDGNATFDVNCEDKGMDKIPSRTVVRLVE